MVEIPEPIKLIYEDIYAINDSKTRVIISKGDSLKTTLVYRNRPPPSRGRTPSNSLIFAIDVELKYIEKLNKFSSETDLVIEFRISGRFSS